MSTDKKYTNNSLTSCLPFEKHSGARTTPWLKVDNNGKLKFNGRYSGDDKVNTIYINFMTNILFLIPIKETEEDEEGNK